jgi:hypothetical protein
MNDTTLPEQYRDEIAARVAPYCHPWLSSIAIAKRPGEMSNQEIAELIGQAEDDLRRLNGRGKWPRRLLNALIKTLQAELARRARVAEDDANQVVDQLIEMVQRLQQARPNSAVQTEREMALVEAVQAGGGWSDIEELRNRADRSPAEVVALMLTQDPDTAFQFLGAYQARVMAGEPL